MKNLLLLFQSPIPLLHEPMHPPQAVIPLLDWGLYLENHQALTPWVSKKKKISPYLYVSFSPPEVKAI